MKILGCLIFQSEYFFLLFRLLRTMSPRTYSLGIYLYPDTQKAALTMSIVKSLTQHYFLEINWTYFSQMAFTQSIPCSLVNTSFLLSCTSVHFPVSPRSSLYPGTSSRICHRPSLWSAGSAGTGHGGRGSLCSVQSDAPHGHWSHYTGGSCSGRCNAWSSPPKAVWTCQEQHREQFAAKNKQISGIFFLIKILDYCCLGLSECQYIRMSKTPRHMAY